MEKKYTAFISYRHKKYDAFLAALLHSRIEQYAVPKELREKGYPRRLGRVFRDKEELAAAPDLTREIYQALDASQNLIVICTRATTAKDSNWISREIAYFKKTHPEGKIYPILAQGDPKQVYPEELFTAFDPKNQKMVEVDPVAVDIRGKNILETLGKLPNELLRMYASILNVDYPQLADRDRKRRRRRAVTAASVFLAVVMSFMGMLLFKNHQIRQTNLLLEQANTTLAQQKEDLLLRSAQLLTQDAEEALKAEDYQAAIHSASQAMTREDGSIFYHAPAERVLLSALDIFDKGEQNVLITGTALEADAPINGVCFSEDGMRTVTVDQFGAVLGFDSLTGQRLWQQRISSSGNEETSNNLWALHNGAAAAFSSNEIAAFSMDTGEVLWRREDVVSVSDIFLCAPDGGSLAYIHSTTEGTDFLFRHSLVVLSADTGEVLWDIPIVEDRTLMEYRFPLEDHGINNCCFSPDGRFFAGSYLSVREDLTSTVHYYVADLEEGTLDVFYSRESDGYFRNQTLGLAIDGENRSLFVLRQPSDDSTAAEILRFRLDTGELLWQTATAEEDIWYFNDTDDLFCLIGKNKLYLARKDRLYVHQISDGACSQVAQAPGRLLSLENTDKTYWATVLDSGEYTLSWLNSTGLRNAAEFEDSFSLGDIQTVCFWNGGFLRGVSEGNLFSHTMVGDLESGYGFAAVIPSDDDSTLIIRRPLIFREAAAQTDISLQEDTFLSEVTLQSRSDGTVAVFPYTTNTSGKIGHHIALFNAEAHILSRLYELPEECSADDIRLLPDGSGYLECRTGRITRYSMAGDAQVLWEGAPMPLPDSQWSDYEKECVCVCLSDGTLLTVLGSDESLTLWTNGAQVQTIPLPQDLNWSTPGTTSFRRILAAGENGYVLLSHYDTETSSRVSQFAAFHIPTRTWTRFPDEVRGTDSRTLCFGRASALAAVIDADDTARIYDLAQGSCRNRISLGISGNSVAFAQFLLEDTVLMVKTIDGQLLLYDAVTGQLLCREQLLTDSPYTPVTAQLDEENQRLYLTDEVFSLTDDAPNCICLDLRSWEPLLRAAHVLGFDPYRGELYMLDGYNEGLTAYRIPTTDELLTLCRKILNG